MAALVLALVTLATASPPALADTVITVTTTADEVDASDGVVSLREAIDQANAAGQPAQVVLAASATYTLTRCNATQPDLDNSLGDLDLWGPHPITIVGNDATITTSCAGQGLLEAWPGAFLVTLSHLTLYAGTNGSVATQRSLTLDHVLVDATTTTTEAVRASGSGSLTLTNSTVSHTTGGPAIIDSQTGGTFTITGSTIADNQLGANAPFASAAGIVAGAEGLTITDSSVVRNNATSLVHPPAGWTPGQIPPGSPTTLGGGDTGGISSLHGQATITNVEFADNQGSKAGALYAIGASISASHIHHNVGGWGGIIAEHGSLTDADVHDNYGVLVGGALVSGTVTRTSVHGNFGSRAGGVLVDLYDSSSVIDTSTVADNHGGQVGGVWVYYEPPYPAAPVAATVRASTVAGNISEGPADPSRSPLAELVGQLSGDATLHLDRSVIGEPMVPARPACAFVDVSNAPIPSPAVSDGFNVVSDGSCFTTAAGTDVVNAGDPGLGPLRDNGGPTLTRSPRAGSVVLDRIPGDDTACAAGGATDQRGAPRRQGPRCDSGAVEAGYGGYHPIDPTRIFDTRTGSDANKVGPGETRTFPLPALGVPTDRIAAVVANVTVTGTDHTSHLTVFPGGGTVPPTSNLNWTAGETIANLVTVMVNRADGSVSVRNNEGLTHVIVDLAGWYDDDSMFDATRCPCGSPFSPVAPARLVDTRTGLGAPKAPLGPGGQLDVPVTGTAGVPADASAVVVNLTGVFPTAATHLTAWPAGGTLPDVSNLNLVPGDAAPNLAVVKVGAGGTITIRNNSGQTNVVVDILGWYGPGGTSRFRPVEPNRLLDTRGPTPTAGQPIGPGATVGVPNPGAGSAMALNVTAVAPTLATHVTAWPTGLTRPPTSNLNVKAGETRPNAVIVGADPVGGVTLGNNAGTVHLLADLAGWFG